MTTDTRTHAPHGSHACRCGDSFATSEDRDAHVDERNTASAWNVYRYEGQKTGRAQARYLGVLELEEGVSATRAQIEAGKVWPQYAAPSERYPRGRLMVRRPAEDGFKGVDPVCPEEVADDRIRHELRQGRLEVDRLVARFELLVNYRRDDAVDALRYLQAARSSIPSPADVGGGA